MRSIPILIVLAAALVAAPPASAHVPQKCVPLFHKAGKMTQAVVRKGNEARDVANSGLNRIRHVRGDEYSMLADRLAQLMGWQRDMFSALAKAIECVEGKR